MPNGWAASALNPERADGCSLLDLVWAAEPFADQAAFEAQVRTVAAQFAGADADAVIAATRAPTPARQLVRDARRADVRRRAVLLPPGDAGARCAPRACPATLFDLGMRLEANPHLVRFALAEGHTVLGHQLGSPQPQQHPRVRAGVRDRGHRGALRRRSARRTASNVIRPPFLSANAATTAALAAMGFTVTPGPDRDHGLGPGALGAADRHGGAERRCARESAILLHDGPVDSPAGQATVDAIALIVDGARARGYCFGVVDARGAGRRGPARAAQRPDPGRHRRRAVPAARLPGRAARRRGSSCRSRCSSRPRTARRCSCAARPATITLTVANPTAGATDGSTTTVTHPLPAGLTSTGASGPGWTCSGTTTVTCTRADVLAPGARIPADHARRPRGRVTRPR